MTEYVLVLLVMIGQTGDYRQAQWAGQNATTIGVWQDKGECAEAGMELIRQTIDTTISRSNFACLARTRSAE